MRKKNENDRLGDTLHVHIYGTAFVELKLEGLARKGSGYP